MCLPAAHRLKPIPLAKRLYAIKTKKLILHREPVQKRHKAVSANEKQYSD